MAWTGNWQSSVARHLAPSQGCRSCMLMGSPTAIIAEDEEVLRQQLREQLASLWPELRIVADAEDGVAALRAFEAQAPDILFLDIQMPGLSGLEVAHQASGRCHVVFVTAYDKYAI